MPLVDVKFSVPFNIENQIIGLIKLDTHIDITRSRLGLKIGQFCLFSTRVMALG